MKRNELIIFKAGLTIMSADKKFIIITGDHNSKKGREFFKQNESAWNDAIEEASRAGYKIVFPYLYTKPYVRYMSDKPPIKNVVKINKEIYSLEVLINMKWENIINVVFAEINKNREKYYSKYGKQFFFVKSANITISNEIKLKFREFHKKPTSFIRIKNQDEFNWFTLNENNIVSTGNGKLKRLNNTYYLKGSCYWAASKYYNQSAKFLAQLTLIKIKPLSPLNKETMWQEIIFEPIPLINEPVVGSDDKVNKAIIQKNMREK